MGDDKPSAELYESGTYAPARAGMDPLIEPLRRLTYRDRSRALAGVAPGARVLELGSGDGAYLASLARRGLAVSGVEPSAAGLAASLARGVPVRQDSVETVEVAEASQDAIVLWHVLEHLDDPEAALIRVREWLVPEGRLVIGVPNLDSLQAAIGGDRWFHQDVPRHRTHFTARGLRAMLERLGFTVLRMRHVVVEHNALGMWQTLLNRLTAERDVAFRFLKRDLPAADRRIARDLAITAAAGALLVLPAVGMELAAGLAGRGGTVVAVAQVDRTR